MDDKSAIEAALRGKASPDTIRILDEAYNLLQAAENRGFHRFTAHVLGENVAIRKLLDRLSNVVSRRSSGGVSELVFVRRRAT